MYDKNPILIEWDRVFELITQNEMVKSYTTIAREHLAQGDTIKYTKTKSKSGAITPATNPQPITTPILHKKIKNSKKSSYGLLSHTNATTP